MKPLLFIISGALLSSSISFAQTPEIPINGDELFGGIQAREIGPALMSGRISDIQGHPSDPNIIYAGTAGGGVWKSQNGGVTFSPISDEYCQSIGTIAIDPQSPNTVWVGTGETWTRNSVSVGNGILKSTDGGKSWDHKGLKTSDRISNIIIHPENSDVVFVGVLGALWGNSEDRGVYKTTDGGTTWENIFPGNMNTGCSELIMDPNDPNVMYAAFWEYRRTAWSFNSGGENSALYKTTDGGKNWNKIHSGFPSGKLGRIAVAVAPSNSKILYATLETEFSNKNGLWRSDDGGVSWNHLNSDFGLTVRPFYFSRIVVDPKNPDVIVKGGLTGSISRDGGKTFRNLGAMHSDIHDIWFDIENSNRMYVATDGGVYRTWDGGNTMEIVENMPVSQFYHVSFDMQEPYNVYGGLQDNGSWYGPSASPGGIEARDWNSIGAGDGFRVYPHPENPSLMYSEMQGADNVWRYDAKTRMTKVVKPMAEVGDPNLRFNWNAAITTSPNNPDRLYIGSQFLHISNDKGDSWKKISPDLTTNDPKKQDQENSGGLSKDNSGAENHCTIFTIAESPQNENVIWVGTDDGNVQVSKDGGKNWTNTIQNISGLPQNTWCYHIEASPNDPATAYAVFDGHTSNDKNAYIYKTTDYGKSWVDVVNGQIPMFCRSFQVDLVNENIMFAGSEMGLYITLDGGQNWAKFENGVPSVAIHYMEMHPRTNDLILGTHGRGIIIVDDVSILREISSDVLNKKVHFFSNKPYEMFEQITFGGESKETQFIGRNPDRSAQIRYYLNKRHTFGKFKLEIQDMEGNFITSLSPEKSKGINLVSWNFTSMAPRMAEGKTLTFGGFTSPRVEAGKYKVIMTKGKDTYETVIELEYPKNSAFTQSERKIQAKTTQTLYSMSEDLAYMVYEVDAYIESVEAQMKDKSSRKLTKMLNQLTELKNSLVITTGDNYVGSAAPQLREKIGELYSLVASYYGKPTQAQLENLKLLEQQMQEKVSSFESWKKKNAKGIDLAIESKEEFLKKS